MAAPRRKADANDTPTSKGSASKGSAGKGSAGKGSKGGASTSKGSKGGGRWSKGGSKGKSAGLRALDLAAHLEAPARGYLLLGEERFLQDAARAALETRLLGPEAGPALQVFDGRKSSLAEVLDELRTVPFFGGGHRLVVVEEAGGAAGFALTHAEPLAAFLEAGGSETATLVLVADKLDARLKTTKALKAAVTIVDCAPIDEAGHLGFVRARAEVYGRSFARGADHALLERLGGQDVPLATLDAEVRKLAGAGEGPITAAQVEALASAGSSEDSFSVIDRYARGDIEGAVGLLQRIFRDGLITAGGQRTRDPSGIAMILLPTFRWDLTRLLKGRALLDKGARPFDITQELRVFRDKDRFVGRLQRASRGELGARHALLRQADTALRNSADPVGTVIDVVLGLALREQALGA